MKPNFNRLSYSISLGSSLIAGSLASVSADETGAAIWFEEAIAQGHMNTKFVYNNVFAMYFDIGC